MPATVNFSKYVVKLADEGIPLRAIARAFEVPAEEVREAVDAALASGQVCFTPRDDWPPGTARDKRVPDTTPNVQSHHDFILSCVRNFHVTEMQARVLVALLKWPECSKEMLHQAIEQGRDPQKETTDPKIVDVVICKLRKKLTPVDVIITTIWGNGYCIKPDSHKVALDLLVKAVAENSI